MIPAGDAHASYIQEIATAPGLLTAHALVGLVLLGAAVRQTQQTRQAPVELSEG